MMDVTEIDLDSLTELELWELGERVKNRLRAYADERDGLYRSTGGYLHAFGRHGAEIGRVGVMG